jgi:steroid 5-alpha reductase family enzyme
LRVAKVTLVFAALLVALGLTGYFVTGHQHPTALIPLWWGLAMGLCGFLAISPSEGRRKLFMHINVTIAALGFLGALVEAVRGYGAARSAGIDPNYIALGAKLIMAALLLIYIKLCVQSFLDARRARQESREE